MRHSLFLVFVIASLFLVGCYDDVPTTEDLEKIISENLKPGSPNQDIVAFLEDQDWVYHFNSHANRYTARNPEEESLPEFHGRNQIYIHVDENRAFLRAEVRKVFNRREMKKGR